MTENEMWRMILRLTGSAFFTAALMGNMMAESGLRANNLQGSFETKLHETDVTYTAKVDDGTFNRNQFMNDHAGYGLCQWTWYSRKAALYDYWKKNFPKRSIGDTEMQINYCIKEIKGYKVWKNKDTGTLAELTIQILKEYEAPADTGAQQQAKRIGYAEAIYKRNYVNEEVQTILNDLDDLSALTEKIRKEVRALE